MEITWLGHSCFRIKGKQAVIVTDPFDKSLGYPAKKPTADIVTISHDHPHHACLDHISGTPKVVRRPGEYEIANVFISGIKTYHDDEKGAVRGKNTVFFMEMEDLRICHLGDLGHVPTPGLLEQIGDADILMIPIGGVMTLGASQAAETISLLTPRLVIPMHYKTDAVTLELEPAERFLKEMGLQETEPQPKLNVTKSTLPIETRVMLLDYR